jgi:D-beta-D-heptose 7-phosphate kinase / D-beta-D-heptose 1-phosphate adenosyltransferase
MYHQFITRFSDYRVLVIGDLMTDRFYHGHSTRLSPEGPVPVVDVDCVHCTPGGAANTAANLALLGAQVTFCSVAGNDDEARQAIHLLGMRNIYPLIILSGNRSTMVKNRIVAGGQILARFDSGTAAPLDAADETDLIGLLEEAYADYDAVVISDYDKGTLTPSVIAALKRLREKHPSFLAVDSRRAGSFRELKPSFLKPNYTEAAALIGLPLQTAHRARQVATAGEAMYKATQATITALTLDEEGAVLFSEDKPVYTAQARPVQNPNVVGAGDVYTSAFTLSSLAGATITQAAEIAASAATLALKKQMTACCTGQELLAALAEDARQLESMEQLRALCDMYRARGRKIVFTNGCFDILHSGHVRYLEQARGKGDVLIVGINNDASIRRMKGPARPVNSLQDRVQVLSAIGSVNHIVSFGNEKDDTPCELIRAIVPDVFVKGGDYAISDLPEAPLVEELGGKVEILPLVEGRSTTNVIRKIRELPLLKSV